MKILLTAFDPFGGASINPALEAVKRVSHTLPGVEIVKIEVPTVFGLSIRTVTEAMDRVKPDAVLCIGQAGGRPDLTPERVAINMNDARVPDNRGNQLLDVPVVAGGPAAYFSTLPVKAMVAAIREAGLPASLSNTAGTFVCNHLMYGVLHLLATRCPGVRGGFMHVPFAPQQVTDRPAPAMSVEDIARGITAAVEAIAAHGEDVHSAEGKDC